jgi:hypothetical protein
LSKADANQVKFSQAQTIAKTEKRKAAMPDPMWRSPPQGRTGSRPARRRRRWSGRRAAPAESTRVQLRDATGGHGTGAVGPSVVRLAHRESVSEQGGCARLGIMTP